MNAPGVKRTASVDRIRGCDDGSFPVPHFLNSRVMRFILTLCARIDDNVYVKILAIDFRKSLD